MQDGKPKLPERYVELVGAVIIHQRDLAWKFRFGNRVKWIPKSMSKVIELRLYIKHSIVCERIHDFNGAFVADSRQTKLCAMKEMPVDEMEKAADKIQDELDKLRQAIQEYKRARDSEVPDDV